ncbi:hypothetical protein CUS_8018 [Ruminococcus albus 8]|uniref:Uncharacterized protein n=1 Tax=Ruminococcus albus 8 TaxID=246199 RepID=E9SAQ6_RUMAL|nr:hypothetical protein CUS_8018 [Ruminococcus albus 8]
MYLYIFFDVYTVKKEDNAIYSCLWKTILQKYRNCYLTFVGIVV